MMLVQLMRRASRFSILILVIAINCFGQDSDKGFRWDWKEAQELDTKQTIGNSKSLSEKERNQLIAAITPRLHSYIDSEKEVREAALRIRIKAVNLGTRSERYFVAQGIEGCSPTGNCELWIFLPKSGKFALVLHRGAVKFFTIQPSLTNGLHDIVLGMHSSAFESGLSFYRFNGSRYVQVGWCDAAFATVGEDDQVHALKTPQLTHCSKK